MAKKSASSTPSAITPVSLAALYTALVSLLIFFIPSNWFLKSWEETGFVRGLFVDYLVPKFYFTDGLLLLLVGLVAGEWWHTKQFALPKQWQWRTSLLAIVTVGFSIIQLWVSPNTTTAWFLAKIIVVLAGAISLLNVWPRLNQRVLMGALALTILVQSALAGYQYLFQQSLGGYWLLGEPTLNLPLGLAMVTTNGVIKILPYGTTAHPNVLGGVLALYLLMWLQLFLKQWQRKSGRYMIGWWGSGAVLVLVTLGVVVLTHSLSALLMMGMGLLVLGWQLVQPKLGHRPDQRWAVIGLIGLLLVATPAVIFSLRDPYADVTSISRRAFLNQAAASMVLTHPITGVGLNAFTLHLEEFAITPEVVRFLQPAHHVPLLWLAETGAVGVGLLLVLAWLFWSWLRGGKAHAGIRGTHVLLAVLTLTPALVFDHYLLTLNTGLLLGMMWMVAASSE